MAGNRAGLRELGLRAGFGLRREVGLPPWGSGVLLRIERVLFLPALMLAAFWLSGEKGLMATGLSLSLLAAFVGAIAPTEAAPAPPLHGVLMFRPQFLAALAAPLAECARLGRPAACLVLRIDGLAELLGRHGPGCEMDVLAQTARRIGAHLRESDLMGRVDGGIAVALAPVRRLDAASMVQIAQRLQQAVAEPMVLGQARVVVTVSVGFGFARPGPETGAGLGAEPGPEPAPKQGLDQTPAALLAGAEAAADLALRHGPGAIRAQDRGGARTTARDAARVCALPQALETGEIRPYFQPQICTDTGQISGLEALVRWHHPTDGILAPAEFLPLIEQAGLTDRLTDVMLRQSLGCLARLEARGHRVPGVSINLSPADLHDPLLARRIEWELDRAHLPPHRLTVEVLETVVACPGRDVVAANLQALAALGCGIDLDDFGMGQAGLANLRRFAIGRIKIDRSFVTAIDTDPEQQRLVAAILSMAERLGLDTVAEGVETPAVHAILGQLGCAHVQGFGIARPMAENDLMEWMAARPGVPALPVRLGRR